MKVISIIIPVYKAERTINRCIDSVLSQTYKNFELILVDDGSPDSSGTICDEYAGKDHRIHVVHKDNEGVSSARNTGLDIVNGNYITFIDSDDYVTNHYLEHLISSDADLIVSGFKDMPEHNNGENFLDDGYYKAIELGDFFSEKGNSMLFKSVWGKLFRTDIIKSNNLCFDKHIIFGEDSLFMLKYLNYCNSICTVHNVDYYYFLSPIRKYSISYENYRYTVHNKVDAYLNLYKSLRLKNYNYIESELKDITSRLFITELNKRYSLRGYKNFYTTFRKPEILYINNKWGGTLYKIIISLVQKRNFILAFLIMRFVYPITFIGKERYI